MKFNLAQWVRDDIARLRGDAYQYFVEINWTNLVIGTVAALLTAIFMALPWLTN